MATAQSPIARQPDQLDYASPTQFRFGVHQLPKVEFLQSVQIFLAFLLVFLYNQHHLKIFLLWEIN